MEREVFSQHIERNEYSNFKLRAETRAIESLYAVIQRMTADQHVLFQTTLEMPRRVTQECKQLIETMGETMRSFHSMIELQSLSMQAIQKQMELSRVPPSPRCPPDYVGLGKTLLEILRDLGMKAMDAGYVRRSLPARTIQELPAIRDAKGSELHRQAHCDAEAASAEGAGGNPQAAAELRRVLSRLGEGDVARAFESPESFKDFLGGIRREIEESREETAQEKAPAPASALAPAVASARTPVAAAPVQAPPAAGTSAKTSVIASGKAPPSSGKTPLPLSKTPPISSTKTWAPMPSHTSPVPSTQMPRPVSAQTPSRVSQPPSAQKQS